MPIFQYTAMDASGKEQKGQHEAASEEAVASFLKEQGMFPTSIKPLAKAVKANPESATAKSGIKRIEDALAGEKAVKESGAKQNKDTKFSK